MASPDYWGRTLYNLLPTITNRLTPASVDTGSDRCKAQRQQGRTPAGMSEHRTLLRNWHTDSPQTQTTNLSGSAANSTVTILRYGSKSFEEYMQQFMLSEVRYKDFSEKQRMGALVPPSQIS
jgi:hypothetical protein